MGLIISGGLGFVVFAEVFAYRRMRGERKLRRHLTLHTRVVFQITAVLILVSALLIMLIEAFNIFKGHPWYEMILPSLFLSVTPRTAGYNTVDIGGLSNPALLLIIALMIIGASPGSTGGGIKTTTFASLIALVFAQIKQRPYVTILNRRLPADVISKTVATVALYLLTVFMASILLEITESWGTPHQIHQGTYLDNLFEVVSALGTVGLSTGITAQLTVGGKLVIILCMFTGRLGTLVIAAFLLGTPRSVPYSLPEERVMIG